MESRRRMRPTFRAGVDILPFYPGTRPATRSRSAAVRSGDSRPRPARRERVADAHGSTIANDAKPRTPRRTAPTDSLAATHAKRGRETTVAHSPRSRRVVREGGEERGGGGLGFKRGGWENEGGRRSYSSRIVLILVT